MIFKIGHNVTRRNINNLIHQYRHNVVLYSIATFVLVVLLSIFSVSNWFLRLYPSLDTIADGSFEFHLIDVGESNASAIVFPNNDILLYDTGDVKYNSEVMTYIDNILLRRGGTIKYVIISHTDLDHVGNVDTILDRYNPHQYYLPNDTNHYNEKYQYLLDNIPSSAITYNNEGLTLQYSGVALTWLSPNRDQYIISNDYSPIILVEYNNYKMLLTGDSGHNIGKDDGANVEAEAIDYAFSKGIDIDVDILIAGHHGSKYSTGTMLLDYAKPEVLLVPVGDNSYGHPANEFYERVVDYDNNHNTNLINNIHTTQQEGNIIINVSPDNSKYKIITINNINSYLFIPYIVIIAIFLIPAAYLLIRSICIYRYLINYYNHKPIS